MALMFLAVATWCLLSGQWVIGVLMLAGVAGALVAFRRGTWDQAAKGHFMNRLVGAAIGLGVFTVVAALGFLD